MPSRVSSGSATSVHEHTTVGQRGRERTTPGQLAITVELRPIARNPELALISHAQGLQRTRPTSWSRT